MRLLSDRDAQLLRLFYGWGTPIITRGDDAPEEAGYTKEISVGTGRPKALRALNRLLVALGKEEVGPVCEHREADVPILRAGVEQAHHVKACRARLNTYHYWPTPSS